MNDLLFLIVNGLKKVQLASKKVKIGTQAFSSSFDLEHFEFISDEQDVEEQQREIYSVVVGDEAFGTYSNIKKTINVIYPDNAILDIDYENPEPYLYENGTLTASSFRKSVMMSKSEWEAKQLGEVTPSDIVEADMDRKIPDSMIGRIKGFFRRQIDNIKNIFSDRGEK